MSASTTAIVGAKSSNGVKQWLIGQMPPHRVFVEAFIGSGIIMRSKRPAAVNIGIDCDRGRIETLLRDGFLPGPLQSQTILIAGKAEHVLPILTVASDWLIYADPPYLLSSRSCKRRYYRHEILTETEHKILLSVLTRLQCKVMLSGYQSQLYSMELPGWRLETFWTVNRRGKRVQECLWCNFPAATVRHDSRFVGSDCWDRQRIKRKAERWRRRLQLLPAGEQQALIESLALVLTDGNGCNAGAPDKKVL